MSHFSAVLQWCDTLLAVLAVICAILLVFMQAKYYNPSSLSMHFKGFFDAAFGLGMFGVLITITVAGLGLAEPLRIGWPTGSNSH